MASAYTHLLKLFPYRTLHRICLCFSEWIESSFSKHLLSLKFQSCLNLNGKKKERERPTDRQPCILRVCVHRQESLPAARDCESSALKKSSLHTAVARNSERLGPNSLWNFNSSLTGKGCIKWVRKSETSPQHQILRTEDGKQSLGNTDRSERGKDRKWK